MRHSMEKIACILITVILLTLTLSGQYLCKIRLLNFKL